MAQTACAAEIAARAKGQIGVPYRRHGRLPGVALDCVGLAAFALLGKDKLDQLPTGYALRGRFLTRIETELSRRGFVGVDGGNDLQTGDLLVFEYLNRQLHLGIFCPEGLVHAHAGLRRVVLTPWPVPWRLVANWRRRGN